MYLKVLGILVCIIAVDVIGGSILTQSTALIAEAGHMAGDCLTVIVSILVAIIVRNGQNEPVARRVGFIFNVGMLLVIAGGIALQAVDRFEHPQAFAGWVVVIAASISLFGSYAAHRVLDAVEDEDRSETHDAQHLHVKADIAQSAGVILAGLFMVATGITIVDPVVSSLIALWMTQQAIRLVLRRLVNGDET
jgi:cobalt-zinc-cadmium efflux system protein